MTHLLPLTSLFPYTTLFRSITIRAYNELYFLIDEPDKTVIESDYGVYDTWVPLQNDNQHQHRGEIRITNRESALRSEEHTSELQSPCNLVCRLLLEKHKKIT